jgi:hypothetical protein
MTSQEIYEAMDRTHKICSNCEKIKNIEEFHKNGNRRRGRCRDCRSDVRKKQRLEKAMDQDLYDLKPNPVEQEKIKADKIRQAIKDHYNSTDEVDEAVEDDKPSSLFTLLLLIGVITMIGLIAKEIY